MFRLTFNSDVSLFHDETLCDDSPFGFLVAFSCGRAAEVRVALLDRETIYLHLTCEVMIMGPNNATFYPLVEPFARETTPDRFLY